MQADKVAHYHGKLKARLAELEGRLDGLETALDAPAPADDAERAIEREGDEVMEQLGQAGLIEIEQIKAALVRIEDKTYGTCAGCGEPISLERLDVLPHTPLCRECA